MHDHRVEGERANFVDRMKRGGTGARNLFRFEIELYLDTHALGADRPIGRVMLGRARQDKSVKIVRPGIIFADRSDHSLSSRCSDQLNLGDFGTRTYSHSRTPRARPAARVPPAAQQLASSADFRLS